LGVEDDVRTAADVGVGDAVELPVEEVDGGVDVQRIGSGEAAAEGQAADVADAVEKPFVLWNML
jgi:hypothetical protein